MHRIALSLPLRLYRQSVHSSIKQSFVQSCTLITVPFNRSIKHTINRSNKMSLTLNVNSPIVIPHPFPNSPLHTVDHAEDHSFNDSILPHKIDRYNGVVIDCSSLRDQTTEQFEEMLEASLIDWSSNNRRGVWLQLSINHSIDQSSFIGVAARQGFVFHHAEGEFCMMTLWIPEWAYKRSLTQSNNQIGDHQMDPVQQKIMNHQMNDQAVKESLDYTINDSIKQSNNQSIDQSPTQTAAQQLYAPNLLPSFHSSSLGVGVFVVNNRGQVLTVVEKYSFRPNFVKLPGGAVDRGENLSVAAVREVREETGIDCEFDCLIGFRHLLHFRFNGADLYFLAIARCLNDDQSIKLQVSEIEKCEWMDVDVFLALPCAQWFANSVRHALYDHMSSMGLTQWSEHAKQRLRIDTEGVDEHIETIKQANRSNNHSFPQDTLDHYPELSDRCRQGEVNGLAVKLVTSASTGKSSFLYVCNNQNQKRKRETQEVIKL